MRLIPHREPDSEITQDHRDVAADLQACPNRALMHVCSHYAQRTGLRKLAMAGGVALTCTANGLLMRSGLLDEIFVQPPAEDDGAALRAALFRAWLRGPLKRRRMPTPFLGPCYDRTAIESALADFSDRVTPQCFDDFTELTRAAAERILTGREMVLNTSFNVKGTADRKYPA